MEHEPLCVRDAVAEAARSPCAKSRRGAIVYEPGTGIIRGRGFNGPPAPLACTGSEFCKVHCGKLCEHAEGRAVRDAWHRDIGRRLDLVHVKTVAGALVAGGPPECWQCSRVILEVGFISRVWLYQTPESIHATPDDRLPSRVRGLVERDAWVAYSPHDFHWLTRRNARLLEHP